MDIALIFDFLSRIKKNNNREWLAQNDKLYRKAQSEFEKLVAYLLGGLRKWEEPLAMVEPKQCIFRFYRDIRFSKDKSPYKIHFGAFFAPGGRNSGNAGYYLHLQPGEESFIGGGLYRPGGENLAKVRQEIDYNASELKKIVEDKAFKKVYGMIQGDKLKRAPKGYEPDHPNIEFLKLKDYLVLNKFSDKEVLDPSFPGQVVKHFRIMGPFIDFLNVAIS